jgi:hypothetical protein
MIYLVSAFIVVGMLGFMFFRVAYSLRPERVRNQREATRGKHAFTRVDRARFLLRRAFTPVEDPSWQIEVPDHLAASRGSDQPKA